MEINPTVSINFAEFIKTGRFDRLRIGQTKEDIFEFFPLSDSAYDDEIWYYGNIELHFRRNMLSMILCEDLNANIGNEGLKIDHWFFDSFKNNLLTVVEILSKYDIKHQIKYHKRYPHQCDMEISHSGVRLGFVGNEEKGNDPHYFYLKYFIYSKLHVL